MAENKRTSALPDAADLPGSRPQWFIDQTFSLFRQKWATRNILVDGHKPEEIERSHYGVMRNYPLTDDEIEALSPSAYKAEPETCKTCGGFSVFDFGKLCCKACNGTGRAKQ